MALKTTILKTQLRKVCKSIRPIYKQEAVHFLSHIISETQAHFLQLFAKANLEETPNVPSWQRTQIPRIQPFTTTCFHVFFWLVSPIFIHGVMGSERLRNWLKVTGWFRPGIPTHFCLSPVLVFSALKINSLSRMSSCRHLHTSWANMKNFKNTNDHRWPTNNEKLKDRVWQCETGE